MSLRSYKSKRNFKRTSEPKGKISKKKTVKLLYIIQKHAASHLHYDFRLELNGVLLSWAIPKGPCLDPSIKRLAVHVEDHPIEYGSFEGIIPQGQYGGGTVMLWDKGEWISEDENPTTSYHQGSMKFKLKAKKLNGSWKLIRMNQDDKTWLLIKAQDKYAKSLKKYDIISAEPNSVTSHVNDELTHPDKILYPEDKITKQQIANYYQEVQEWILPYITQRLLTLVRCPDNYKKCFYQKHITESSSNKLHSLTIKEKEGKSNCIYIDDAEGLLTLAQLGVLEIHPWESLIKNVEYPDMIIFDLDPAPDVTWEKVVYAAKDIQQQLLHYGLKSFVKTTGGKGLHVVAPIKPEYTWDEVKNFSKTFVDFMVLNNPKEYTNSITKIKRKGKIFIDYLRNQRGATAVAPYSPRARLHAPVATPVHWDELTTKFQDTFFTIHTIGKRLNHIKDPWKDFYKTKQSLNIKNCKK